MVVSIIYINLLFFFFMKIIEYNFDEAERPEAYLYLVDLDVIIIYIYQPHKTLHSLFMFCEFVYLFKGNTNYVLYTNFVISVFIVLNVFSNS